jgi:hypothetical protein
MPVLNASELDCDPVTDRTTLLVSNAMTRFLR